MLRSVHLHNVGDDLQGLKILYVEDDSAIRESLSKFLSRRSCELISATNGAEGISKFKEYMPDLIVTDIRMPVMDGLDMVEQIRRISTDIPIVITTAHNDEEFYQRAIDLGVDKYIKKPINLRELINIITRSARIILQQRELDAQSRLIKEILDISRHFMMIIKDGQISYVNKPLLAFAQCTHIDEFRDKYSNLEGLIVDAENAFYHDKKMDQWLEIAAKEEDKSNLIVYMRAPGDVVSQVSAYILQVNRFSASSDVLLSFSDVTNIEKEKNHYQEIAQFDELTQIYNRKKFNEELVKEMDRAKRYNQHLSLATFDVDFFKHVNDTYGHPIGDYVLKDIVHVVKGAIRKSDIFSRYGGEEFMLLMPETPLNSAIDTVERIRKNIEEHPFDHVGNIRCSFGVSEYKHEEDTSVTLIKRVDDALYNAKNNGRNRTEFL